MARVKLPHSVSFVPEDHVLWKQFLELLDGATRKRGWYDVLLYGYAGDIAQHSKTQRALAGNAWDSYQDRVQDLFNHIDVTTYKTYALTKSVLVIGLNNPNEAHMRRHFGPANETISAAVKVALTNNPNDRKGAVKRGFLTVYYPPQNHPAVWEAANGCWDTYGYYLFLDRYTQNKRSAA